MPATRLMLASIPIFATAAGWSGVAIPVAVALIVILGLAAILLSGWGFEVATWLRPQSRHPNGTLEHPQ